MKKIELSDNAQKVAKSRYYMNGEDWQQCIERVSSTISQVEVADRGKYKSLFFDMIYNMDFIPAGRILRNSGRARGSLLNCFHLGIGDSIEEIGQCLKDCLVLWSEGAGVGVAFSPLRPRGDSILGKGGNSSGMVSFMEAFDAAAKTIESGGARRAAALGLADISHPEIVDFIDAKLTHGKLPHFNISVGVNEEFIEAVEAGKDWTFKFKQKEYGRVKAVDLWNKIISNMITCAEPGLINMSKFQKNNSYYFAGVTGTNPCLTGETLIAVADGRNYIPIKKLAEEGKDVPVFSFNEESGKTEVQIMRNPRMTGKKVKILKVTLDDGSSFKCTENHSIYKVDGELVQAKNLNPGDRLNHMVKYKASLKEVTGKPKIMEYSWITNGLRNTKAEHRIIAEHKLGRDLEKNEVVHHIDRNCTNNSPDNLEVLSKEDHDKLHGELMKGSNNPVNRFPEKNWLIKQNWKGEKNGRYLGFNGKSLLDIAIKYSKKFGRRLKGSEWYQICKQDRLPIDQTGVDQIDEIKNINGLLKYAAKKAGVYVYESSIEIREYEKFLRLKKETDLDIFFDKSKDSPSLIYVRKHCEGCGEQFITPWINREKCYCTNICANKYKKHTNKTVKAKQKVTRKKQVEIYKFLIDKLKRDPLQYEWQEECKKNNVSYRIRLKNEKCNKYCFNSFKELKEVSNSNNYKVVSVKFDGYSNVYNGTVDKNHNFYSMVNITKTKSGKIKYNHILNRNCGETCLAPGECCDLGSLVLPNFITGNINTNWKKLETTIKLATRFLDNVLDINKYTLKEIDINAHRSRRIGIGVIGLAEYLFAKKLRYGSEKAVAETERLMKFIRDVAYQASVELAVEKGAFPAFEPIAYGKASFVRKLNAQVRMDIKKFGVRNCTLMALAPTGTISLLCDYTSGIEPLFAKALMRNDRVGERIYIHPKYQEMIFNDEEIPDWFVDSFDLEPKDHFEMQVACQRYCDASVSKTINLPKKTTEQHLSDLLLEYIHDLKGVTVYRDGSREGQILKRMTEKQVKDYLLTDTQCDVDTNLDEDQVQCASGSCEI